MLRALLITSALTLACVFAACPDGKRDRNGELRSVDLGGGQAVQVPKYATRIVPGNAAVLDFCAALIGPERFAALPKACLRYSNIPADAQEPWQALPVMEGLHLEDLASAKVDLIIAHDWQEPALGPLLERAGIPVLFLPTVHSEEDIFRSMKWVSLALGVPDAGQEQIQQLQERVENLAAAKPKVQELTAMVYSNYGAGGGTAGSGTSYDLMIRLTGMKNAAAQAGIRGHADLDLEGLLTIQPDVIILSTGPDGSSSTLAALRSELESIPLKAVEKDQIALMKSNELTTTSQFTLNAAENLQAQVLEMLAR
ncbi:MAG: ABC transporter substrate-binding protein [Planctomycetes bacterium]|nr:ABC transporter substrate-binding protein [Planctomycetota bacterium]